MAQGKKRDKDKVIRALKPFFQLGCDVKKACEYGGVPYTTVHTWLSNDEELRIKINAWQNEVSYIARKNWKKAIKDGDVAMSERWLTKKEKDEFSDRQEHTGKDGGAIQYEDLSEMSDEQLDELIKEGASGESKA